ncbi:hypothetical protein KBD71_00915 [Candidatus Woesebacteria bacterium]|nr:hypothetical protein [Candidatus Woesebacteria bacterium]
MGSEIGSYDLETYAKGVAAEEYRNYKGITDRFTAFDTFVTKWMERVLEGGPGAQKIGSREPVFQARGIKQAYRRLFDKSIAQEAGVFTAQINMMSGDETKPLSASQIEDALKAQTAANIQLLLGH